MFRMKTNRIIFLPKYAEYICMEHVSMIDRRDDLEVTITTKNRYKI